MIRVVLHNSQDAESRRYVAEALAADPTIAVYDWYDGWYDGGVREQWLADGGTDAISALPSVVLDVAEHTLPERTLPDGTVLPARTVLAHQHPVRLPLDWSEALAADQECARLVSLCAQAARTAEETAELWALADGVAEKARERAKRLLEADRAAAAGDLEARQNALRAAGVAPDLPHADLHALADERAAAAGFSAAAIAAGRGH